MVEEVQGAVYVIGLDDPTYRNFTGGTIYATPSIA